METQEMYNYKFEEPLKHLKKMNLVATVQLIA